MRVNWATGYRGLLVRKVVILSCAAVAVVRDDLWQAVAITLLLTALSVVGTLPSWRSGWQQPVAEAVAAGLVVAVIPTGQYFAPYLLLPIAAAGLMTGLRHALYTFAAAAVTLTAVAFLQPRVGVRPSIPSSRTPLLLWLPLLAAAAPVAVWARQRLRPHEEERAETEPAYADAHRLLSELNLVARQLSLGLDPHTLATALVEELQGMVPGARATVLIRSAGGRFVPVIGDPPNPLTESAVLDAWVSADLVRRGRSGVTVVALPVLMGERVVAVVVLADVTGANGLGDESVQACRTVISQAGPRLASALLFDDVRRLATVDERHRLAREIHDGIAQDMASVGYQIDDIASDAASDVARRLHDLREHLTILVSELRLSIFDLRTGVDESMGLSRTLGDYAQRVGKQAGLVVHVSADESPHRLPMATEVEVLRIVQEAVTNVRRHAYATNLWLTVVVDPPNVRVEVTDDGCGLGPPRPDSMGIIGMTERATRIGATLTVADRVDGPGTVVTLAMEADQKSRHRAKAVAAAQKSTHSNYAITDAGYGVLMADSADGSATAGATWEGTS